MKFFTNLKLKARLMLGFGIVIVMSLLIGWKWKTKDLIVPECEQSGHRFWGYKFFDFCYRFVTPIGMTVVLVGQIIDFFVAKPIA